MDFSKEPPTPETQDIQCSQVDSFHSGRPLGSTGNIFGLVNGMVGGGASLILPQMGMQTGYINIVWISLLTGYFAYYTADLIVLHLGKGKNAKESILSHFQYDYKYMRIYSFIIWFSFMPILLAYFRLTCLQIEGIMGYNGQWTGTFVAFTLIASIILIRALHLGQEILAFGMLSIIMYVMFLIWALWTAPLGPKTVPYSGPTVAFAANMLNAYQLHDFLSPNLIRNPNRQQYRSVVRWTFFISVIIYTFLSFGSFAIVNRHPLVKVPQIINDYFLVGQWQITVIQIVYLMQMVTAYPAFLIISKCEFFTMFKIKLKQSINWQEIGYIIAVVALSYLFFISNTRLQIICSINGAIVGFTYVVMMPIWVHLKCVWYDRASGYIEGDQEWNRGIMSNVCECKVSYRARWTLYLQTAFLLGIVVVNIALIIFTIETIIPTHPLTTFKH